MSEAPTVTVAGGGIAGLTAALRLAERGYGVKLYEQKPVLGGNLASRRAAGGVHLDVYPHMYGNWYHNFWRLLGDASGLEREQLFVPMSGVKQLRAGEFPRFLARSRLRLRPGDRASHERPGGKSCGDLPLGPGHRGLLHRRPSGRDLV